MAGMRHALTAIALLAAPAAGIAATLDVTVRDAAGKPVRDAVVTVVSAAGKPAAPPRFAWPARVTQQDISFDPYVLIVPVGAVVAFPNKDKVRHHVYSFSKAKKFDLKLYGRDESRSVTFDKAGPVALGCNIHDGMTAFVQVVDTPWAAKSDAAGRVSLAGLPAGPAKIRVWHPYARVKNNEVVLAVSLPASGTTARAVSLALAPGHRH